MIIYYQGLDNNEFLYTNQEYYNDMLQIDKDEYDIQPTVEFTMPGKLLNDTEFDLYIEYIGMDEYGTPNQKNINLKVLLDKFGIRQTELQYIADIGTLIHEQFIQQEGYESIKVIYDSAFFIKTGRIRYIFSCLKVHLTITSKNYWLAKLMGVKPNEKLESVFDTKTQTCSLTFNYPFCVNFVETLYVTCPYISKQMQLAKHKKYVILKRQIDAAPFSRISVSGDIVSTITKEQLFKGLQIAFCDENFQELPLDKPEINTDLDYQQQKYGFNLSLAIQKSRIKAQLEVEMQRRNESKQQMDEREAYIKRQQDFERKMFDFKYNYDTNEKLNKIFDDSLVMQQQKYFEEHNKLQEIIKHRIESGVPYTPQDKQRIANLNGINQKYDKQIKNAMQTQRELYAKSKDNNLPLEKQIEVQKQLNQFFNENKDIYNKLYLTIHGIQKRLQSVANNSYDEDFKHLVPYRESAAKHFEKASPAVKQKIMEEVEEYKLRLDALDELMKEEKISATERDRFVQADSNNLQKRISQMENSKIKMSTQYNLLDAAARELEKSKDVNQQKVFDTAMKYGVDSSMLINAYNLMQQNILQEEE
ncbi:Hypothetical_protein [Hexamita inflata]|uniref:Hypothetical_protein n=1 Tax=Hexamita inflata TaxID=28002 RepID=A0AA86U994_9EUKA|nr:Hypothetical protein HINF_LOCUS21753 [Hexamita inflata]